MLRVGQSRTLFWTLLAKGGSDSLGQFTFKLSRVGTPMSSVLGLLNENDGCDEAANFVIQPEKESYR